MKPTLAILIGLLVGILGFVLLAGCQQNVSATQPSPIALLGENIAYRVEIDALNKAYTARKIDYPTYNAATIALTTLYTNAKANGGAVTQADITDAIGAGAATAIEAYIPNPTIIPAPTN